MSEQTGAIFQKYISSFVNFQAQITVWTFAELAIADILADADTPLTAEEIAQKHGWRSESLYRLLRTVADVDIVREIKSDETLQPEKLNRFELTEHGQLFVSSHPGALRYWCCWAYGSLVQQASLHLPALIREGSSKRNGLQYVLGDQNVFDYLQKDENKHHALYFNQAMACKTTHISPDVAKAVDFSRFDTIVDIGGGTGSLMAEILKAYPTIKQGICFDLPAVIETTTNANEFEKRSISQDRYKYVAGDMFDPKTIPHADAYAMKCIIHDWEDERSIEILKSIREAANSKPITVFVIEVVILPEAEENKMTNRAAHSFDIHMMIMVDAKERTQHQYEYLLKQSGFEFKRLFRTSSVYSVIEAVSE